MLTLTYLSMEIVHDDEEDDDDVNLESENI
jgi:hypothetical protein